MLLCVLGSKESSSFLFSKCHHIISNFGSFGDFSRSNVKGGKAISGAGFKNKVTTADAQIRVFWNQTD